MSARIDWRARLARRKTARPCATARGVDGIAPEQLAALHAWRAKYGRTWKTDLLDAWYFAGDGVPGYSPELQQLRNQYGPEWLEGVRL
jgi:hypothetical protein